MLIFPRVNRDIFLRRKLINFVSIDFLFLFNMGKYYSHVAYTTTTYTKNPCTLRTTTAIHYIIYQLKSKQIPILKTPPNFTANYSVLNLIIQ